MGVEGVFPFLKSHNIEGTEVDIRTFEGRIHVDVLSLFRAYIIATEASLMYRIARREARVYGSTGNELQRVSVPLAFALDARLARTFRKDTDVLHFDGSPTSEKGHARTIRNARYQVQLTKAKSIIGKVTVDLPSPSIHPSFPCTRSKRQKIVKMSKKAFTAWKYARTIDHNLLNALIVALHSNGWSVCRCEGEADVCISKQDPGNVVVASSDSDYLFHQVRTLLRQDPQRRSTFLQFNIQGDILNRLSISEAEWICAGIVSRNDYNPSMFGHSFARNLGLINLLKHDLLHRNVTNITVRQLLTNYCTNHKNRQTNAPVDTQLFDNHYVNSTNIFLLREERTIQVQQTSNNTIDDMYMSMIQGLGVLFRQYKDHQRTQRSLGPVPAVPASPSSTPASPVSPISGSPAPSVSGSQVSSASASSASSVSGSQASFVPSSHASSASPASPTPSISSASSNSSAAPASRPRPFEKYMPPNKYRARNFTIVPVSDDSADSSTDGDGGDNSTTINKPKSRKRKGAHAGNITSSRKARRVNADEAGTGGTPKTLNPYRAIHNALESRYGIISMDCGTLRAQLSKALAANFIGDERDRKTLRSVVFKTIQEMVRIGTDAIRIAQQAIACYIADITQAHPTLSAQDIQERKNAFTELSILRNNAFFGNLLHDIFEWYTPQGQKARGRPRAATEANQVVTRIIASYRQALAAAGHTVPNLKGYIQTGLSQFFQLIGLKLSDQIQPHFIRNISELVQRLRNHNPAGIIVNRANLS